AWTTLTRCPHTHSHNSSKQLNFYERWNGTDPTLIPVGSGPHYGGQLRLPRSTRRAIADSWLFLPVIYFVAVFLGGAMAQRKASFCEQKEAKNFVNAGPWACS
ncbi:hypothetical protein, partial [Acidocella sp.]|uniref:hypothetical protein n=1 Tax=Acidocella sp. TaxID=50710 RepID=UPI002F3F4420